MDLPWAHKRVLDEQGDLQGARLCPAAIQALLNADCPPHKVTVPDDQPVIPAAWRTSIEGAARRASAAVGGVGAQQATRRGLTGSYRTVWRALRDNRGPRSGGARRRSPCAPTRGKTRSSIPATLTAPLRRGGGIICCSASGRKRMVEARIEAGLLDLRRLRPSPEGWATARACAVFESHSRSCLWQHRRSTERFDDSTAVGTAVQPSASRSSGRSWRRFERWGASDDRQRKLAHRCSPFLRHPRLRATLDAQSRTGSSGTVVLRIQP